MFNQNESKKQQQAIQDVIKVIKEFKKLIEI